MAQALEKRKMSPKLRKFFCTKNSYVFPISVFDDIQFSQNSLINRKNPTTYPSTASPGATNLNKILLLSQAPV